MELGKLKAIQTNLHWCGNLRLCSHFLLLVPPRKSLFYFIILFTLPSL